MARLSAAVISYFVIAAVMWGSGVLDAGSGLGILDLFFNIQPDGTVTTSGEPEGLLGNMGDLIENEIVGSFVAPVLAIWQTISQLISAMFWPVTALWAVGAPAEIVVLVGGTPTAYFFMSIIRTIKDSA